MGPQCQKHPATQDKDADGSVTYAEFKALLAGGAAGGGSGAAR